MNHDSAPRAADPTPWRERWQQGTTGWDLGAPHKLTIELVKLARARGRFTAPGRVYMPGAGRAHDAAVFVGAGSEVVAADFAPEAMAEARRLYQALPRLSFVIEDVLATAPETRATFDAVFDRAMLCALDPVLRPSYARAIAHRLRPGGVLLAIPF